MDASPTRTDPQLLTPGNPGQPTHNTIRTHRRHHSATHSVRRSIFRANAVQDPAVINSSHDDTNITDRVASNTTTLNNGVDQPDLFYNTADHHQCTLSSAITDLKNQFPTTKTFLTVDKPDNDSLNINYDIKRTFLVRLTEALTCFGAPGYRIEHLLQLASDTLKVNATFAILPNLVIMTYEDPILFETETILLNIRQGYDLGRLLKTNTLCRRLATQDITLEQATNHIEILLDSNSSTWSTKSIMISSICASAFIAPLSFHGSWLDILAAALLSTIARGIELLATKFSSFSFIYTTLCAFIISFTGVLFKNILSTSYMQILFPNTTISFQTIVLSAMLNELPGLMLCTSFVELTSAHMISGTVRLASGVVIALSLAFGLSSGYHLYGILNPSSIENLFVDCTPPTCYPIDTSSEWVYMVHFLLLGTAISIAINLRASIQQFPIMILNTVVGFWIGTWLDQLGMSGETVSVITAFSCGLVGNLYSRITGNPGIAPLLAGVIMLVPGSLGVRSSLQLIDSKEYPAGTSFAFRVLLIALSLALGILASRIIPPIETILKKKRILNLQRAKNRSLRAQSMKKSFKLSPPSPSSSLPTINHRDQKISIANDLKSNHTEDPLRYLRKLSKWLLQAEVKRKHGQVSQRELTKVNKWLQRWETSHILDEIPTNNNTVTSKNELSLENDKKPIGE